RPRQAGRRRRETRPLSPYLRRCYRGPPALWRPRGVAPLVFPPPPPGAEVRWGFKPHGLRRGAAVSAGDAPAPGGGVLRRRAAPRPAVSGVAVGGGGRGGGKGSCPLSSAPCLPRTRRSVGTSSSSASCAAPSCRPTTRMRRGG